MAWAVPVVLRHGDRNLAGSDMARRSRVSPEGASELERSGTWRSAGRLPPPSWTSSIRCWTHRAAVVAQHRQRVDRGSQAGAESFHRLEAKYPGGSCSESVRDTGEQRDYRKPYEALWITSTSCFSGPGRRAGAAAGVGRARAARTGAGRTARPARALPCHSGHTRVRAPHSAPRRCWWRAEVVLDATRNGHANSAAPASAPNLRLSKLRANLPGSASTPTT